MPAVNPPPNPDFALFAPFDAVASFATRSAVELRVFLRFGQYTLKWPFSVQWQQIAMLLASQRFHRQFPYLGVFAGKVIQVEVEHRGLDLFEIVRWGTLNSKLYWVAIRG